MKMSLRSLLDPFLPSGPSSADAPDTPPSSTPSNNSGSPPAHDQPAQHSASSAPPPPPPSAPSPNPPHTQEPPSPTAAPPSPSAAPAPAPSSPSPSKGNNHNEQTNDSSGKQSSPTSNSNTNNNNNSPSPAEPTSQASTPNQPNDNSSANDRPKSKHSKTLMTSSATEVLGVATATDGKIYTYTSTSYKPYSTIVADAADDEISGSQSSAPSSAVAGGVIGGLLLVGILGLCTFFVMKRKKRSRGLEHASGTKDMDDLMQYRSPAPTTAATTPVMTETTHTMAPAMSYEHDAYQGYQQQGYYYQPQQDPAYGYDSRMLTAAYTVDHQQQQQQQQPPQPVTLSDPAGPATGAVGGTSVYRTPSYNYQQQQQQQQQQYMPHQMDYSGGANYYQAYPAHQPASDGGYYQPHLVHTDVPHTKD